MPKPKRTLRAPWFRPPQETQMQKQVALISAARKLAPPTASKQPDATGKLEPWQLEAWEHYHECGPLRYMVNLAADMMSRARLYLTKIDPDSGEPMEQLPEGTPDMPAVFGGPIQQKRFLHDFGLQLGVPGDCYFVGEEEMDPEKGTPTGRERWSVLSLEEFTETRDGRWVIDDGSGKREVPPDTTAVIRVWKPNPRHHDWADSQVRANVRPLRILARLAKYTQAILDSRLAGPGILLLPDSITFQTPDSSQQPEQSGGTSTFMQVLQEAMTTAIQDPDSVSSVVPIVVQGPAEALKEARLLTMNTPLADNLTQIETQAITSLALGLDAPPDVLKGLADTNHWSAWQIEDATIKYVCEPLLELICAALTEQFVWTVLVDQPGLTDPFEWLIWYDATELSANPDKSGNAKDLFAANRAIGEDALRRENGFTDADKPTQVEREYVDLMDFVRAVPGSAADVAKRLVALIGARAQGLPELAGQLTTVEVQSNSAPRNAVDGQGPDGTGADSGPGSGTDSSPTTDTTGTKGPPTRDSTGDGTAASAALTSRPEPDPGLLSGCEIVALAMIRRANLKNAGRQRWPMQQRGATDETLHLHVPVLESKLNELLPDGPVDDVQRIAERFGIRPLPLWRAIRGYVAETLVGGTEHDVSLLEQRVEAEVFVGSR